MQNIPYHMTRADVADLAAFICHSGIGLHSSSVPLNKMKPVCLVCFS